MRSTPSWSENKDGLVPCTTWYLIRVFLDIILSIEALKTELMESRVRDQQHLDEGRAA